MPKKLAFEQRIHECGSVADCKFLLAHWTGLVKGRATSSLPAKSSARYASGCTRSTLVGSINRRNTSAPEAIGRKSRMCFPDCSDQCNSVFSTKKSSLLSQPETSTE